VRQDVDDIDGRNDAMSRGVPRPLTDGRAMFDAALRACLDRIPDDVMRRVATYQLGWCDAAGRPVEGGGGKAIRPALTLLSAEAVGADPVRAVPAAVAVELVHNFSLLHDDVMDRDLERRHRPTGWVAFGEGQALLAGNAMLTAAVEVLLADGEAGQRALPSLLTAVQDLISGQSQDLLLESRSEVDIADVLRMEAGKTGALISCSCAIGAIAVGADDDQVGRLAGFGHDLGIAFQLVDDILGITGDPAVTGKSSSSDVRAGKRSAPIVAALNADNDASRRLAKLLADGPPQTEDDVSLASSLIAEAGGLDWASAEANTRLGAALHRLDTPGFSAGAVARLDELARYIVERDH
jgi:geranylgeranyl diphosphate synthase type I